MAHVFLDEDAPQAAKKAPTPPPRCQVASKQVITSPGPLRFCVMPSGILLCVAA